MSNDTHADNSLGAVLDRLARVIEARKGADPDSSYTAKLISKGASHCARKFGEEAIEAIIAATQGDAKELTAKARTFYIICLSPSPPPGFQPAMSLKLLPLAREFRALKKKRLVRGEDC